MATPSIQRKWAALKAALLAFQALTPDHPEYNSAGAALCRLADEFARQARPSRPPKFKPASDPGHYPRNAF